MSGRLFAFLFLILFISSCSQSSTKKDEIFNEVDLFLNYAKEKNEKAIYDMCYPSDDPEGRKFMVERFSKLINKYGVPPHDKWVLEQTPLDYEVHIPISNFNDPDIVIKNVKLIISYTPPGIGNKIHDFSVRSETDTSKKLILVAPPLVK